MMTKAYKNITFLLPKKLEPRSIVSGVVPQVLCGLEGMKIDNIKPGKFFSSTPLATG